MRKANKVIMTMVTLPVNPINITCSTATATFPQPHPKLLESIASILPTSTTSTQCSMQDEPLWDSPTTVSTNFILLQPTMMIDTHLSPLQHYWRRSETKSPPYFYNNGMSFTPSSYKQTVTIAVTPHPQPPSVLSSVMTMLLHLRSSNHQQPP